MCQFGLFEMVMGQMIDQFIWQLIDKSMIISCGLWKLLWIILNKHPNKMECRRQECEKTKCTMNRFFFHRCSSNTMSIQNWGFCISAQLKQSRLSQRTALKIGAWLFLRPRVAGLFSLLSHFSAGLTAQHLELWSFQPFPLTHFSLDPAGLCDEILIYTSPSLAMLMPCLYV